MSCSEFDLGSSALGTRPPDPAPLRAFMKKYLESALEAVKKAVELAPDAFNSWNTLSQINLKLKKYDEALKAAERAAESAPSEQLKNIFRKQIDQIKAAQDQEKK